MNSTLLKYLLIVLLIGLGIGAYANSLKGPFVCDDKDHIANNPHIRLSGISCQSLKNVFEGPGRTRPLPMLSFALNYYFGDYNLAGFHAVNIFIHLMTGVLLFFFSQAILRQPSGISRPLPADNERVVILSSFFAALLWMVHPANTQTVAYIVQRMCSMMAFFFLLSVFCYVKARQYQRVRTTNIADKRRQSHWPGTVLLLACVVFGLMAMASKENAAVLPVIIVFLEWLFFQQGNRSFTIKFFVLLGAGIAFLSFLAFFWLGEAPIERVLAAYWHWDFSLTERLLTELRVVIYYISLYVLPSPMRLNFDHDYPISQGLFAPWTTLLSAAALVCLLVAAFFQRRKSPLFSFAVIWFISGLVIESSIIPIDIIFEHRTYLPFMMFILFFAVLWFRYVRLRILSVGLLCILVVIFSLWTRQRNAVWQSEASLWGDSIQKSPDKTRPVYNYGWTLKRAGQLEAAIPYLRRALDIDPTHVDAQILLGNCFLQLGRYEKARQHQMAAIQLERNNALAHVNLGHAVRLQGDLKEAEKYYKKAIRLDPKNGNAYYNLGGLFYDQGKLEKALYWFEKAVKRVPGYPEVYVKIGDVYRKQAEFEKAESYYNKALSRKPDHVEALIGLGVVSRKMQAYDRALEYLKKALSLAPENYRAHYNLGLVSKERGNLSMAVSFFKRVLELNPSHRQAQQEINAILNR